MISNKDKELDCRHGDTNLKGYLAYDEAIEGKRPAVLIVPDFRGLGDFVRERAEALASLGYVALAIDMYGVKPRNDEEARALAKICKDDQSLMRSRAASWLEVLKKRNFTDPKRVAVVGYCFGGGVALELARSGADIAGVVGFHATLKTSNPADSKNIKGKVLIFHGADDPVVPIDEALAFQDEMRKAKVDWQMVFYGSAVHSFTMPRSAPDQSKRAAYNEEADRRSWEGMKAFFAEIFG